MKRVRITYEGAFHHVMNRGINDEDIFCPNRCKAQFLDYLEEYSKKLKIRIFSYCIMDNHYHLVLENSSGRLSDFGRDLNSNYGMFYRKLKGGKGYVFQNRFKSTLIQDDSYLKMTIAYVLSNPVKAGIVEDFSQYIWSSGSTYFSKQKSSLVDTQFVNELFGNRSELLKLIEFMSGRELPIHQGRVGEIIGEERFLKEALEKYDRRRTHEDESEGFKRIGEGYFEPMEKVIWEFEHKIGLKLEDVNIKSHRGKRLRGELLVLLKDLSGLKYPEIIEIPMFSNLSLNSLPKLYQDAKKRQEAGEESA